MLSTSAIAEAKKRTDYRHGKAEILHEHDDCIRIAYEWLDAQVNTKGITRLTRPLKHIIENWGGRYVSQSDVEVAAELRPKIKGVYPHFNISAKLTRPSDSRLSNISEARTQNYSLTETARDIKQTYRRSEKLRGLEVSSRQLNA